MKRVLSLSIALSVASALFAVGGATAASGTLTSSGKFPITVLSGDGKIYIKSRPTRILSLSASATQMLYAIGAGSQVVGVDKYSTYPPNAPRTGFSGYETSAEAYLRFKPDLVLMAFDTSHVVEQLKKLHIATLLLPPATSIAGANAQTRELGIATGHTVQATKEVASQTTFLQKVSTRVGATAKGKSYYVELDPTLYSATSSTFIGALFSRFGMVNIADKAPNASSGYPQLSSEYLVSANPQFVFLADTTCCQQSVKTFDARPGYSTISAFLHNEVFPVNDSIASQWGPHSLEAMFTLIATDVTKRTGA